MCSLAKTGVLDRTIPSYMLSPIRALFKSIHREEASSVLL